jgi:hypothetical protein
MPTRPRSGYRDGWRCPVRHAAGRGIARYRNPEAGVLAPGPGYEAPGASVRAIRTPVGSPHKGASPERLRNSFRGSPGWPTTARHLSVGRAGTAGAGLRPSCAGFRLSLGGTRAAGPLTIPISNPTDHENEHRSRVSGTNRVPLPGFEPARGPVAATHSADFPAIRPLGYRS